VRILTAETLKITVFWEDLAASVFREVGVITQKRTNLRE
jgi:hypothetical protein